MARLYHTLKALWLRIPKSIRQLIRTNKFMNYVKDSFREKLAKHALHNDIYDKAFYDHSDQKAVNSAPAITKTIILYFNPSTVIDVGCGCGALLQCLKKHSIKVEGLEYAEAGLDICRMRGLNVKKFDLENDIYDCEKQYDLVVSMEVAEHLAESCADRYVDLLCGLSNNILITAAEPGYGGTNHVNEQPHEYWIDKLDSKGYTFDKALSIKLRSDWKRSNVAWCYYQSAMFFRKH